MNETLTTTPFGRRSLSLGMLAANMVARECPTEAVVHKWKIFNAICEAKAALGASDRALAVLNALLSFHPETVLTGEGDLIVFPSNVQLALRAHGMPPATLRRHLAVLVNCGLVIRRDSPNGKRYARKGQGGEIETAFGFDLTPLVARAQEIEQLADTARQERRALLLLRERVTLYRREIAKMIAVGLEEGVPGDWNGLHATYRGLVQRIPRLPTKSELEPVALELTFLMDEIRNALEFHLNSRNPGANESQFERHIQNSNPESLTESELAFEEAKGKVQSAREPQGPVYSMGPQRAATDAPPPLGAERRVTLREQDPTDQVVPMKGYPLGMVLDACPDIIDYAKGGIASWRDLIAAAELVRKILGISPSAWEDAQVAMGPEAAGVVIAAMLQKAATINSAGGYLRNLTEKARGGQFSIGPMLMALLRTKRRVGKVRA
ncbi:replication initiation protein [Labrys miyagiensis]|uniref:Replication initiation protein n=1 Tax=Labrys miyagiensis TaxID=346912 RepID=A0ABQ6CKQ7_9HYPH|nr:plasmid replication protein RepC [Labrys miyagiensis]GLS20212.1 replication initiation protein [Labrys miyagiensis]